MLLSFLFLKLATARSAFIAFQEILDKIILLISPQSWNRKHYDIVYSPTVLQLIAAYSTPPAPAAPPDTPDVSYDSARLDFKDSDMKRLSMEIERERWVGIPYSDIPRDTWDLLFMSVLMQTRVHGEEQTSPGPTERVEDRDRVFETGGAAATGWPLQPSQWHEGIRPGTCLHTSQQCV